MRCAAKGSTVNLPSMNLWLTAAAAGLLTAGALFAQDEGTSAKSPYRNLAAADDTGSGSSGASDASSDASPSSATEDAL